MALIGVSSPLRLLRENWRSPTMLAQELYAMFTSKEPATIDKPVEIRVGRDQPGLTITQGDRQAEGPANAMAATRARSPVASAPSPVFERPAGQKFEAFTGRSESPADRPGFSRPASVDFPSRAATSAYQAPAFSVNGPVSFPSSQPVQFSVPPMVLDEHGVFQAIPPAAVQTPPRAMAFGTVSGGSGNEWTVTVTAGNVVNVGDEITVTIPYIDSEEEAPEGIVVGPILGILVGKQIAYYSQPPVWMP